jgi:hypothetical protein
MKQTKRKKKTLKAFSDLKQSWHEALAYQQGKKGILRVTGTASRQSH